MSSESGSSTTLKSFSYSTPRPIFGGNTGGFLWGGLDEEIYAIIWESKKSQFFELPTGGSAIMRVGENLQYFARKEQCLALATQLRSFKLQSYSIYRIFANGEVHHLHPNDGVFPEKVNKGRVQVGFESNAIGKVPPTHDFQI